MLQIAIVEDEKEHAELLDEFVKRFFDGKGASAETVRFDNAIAFLENYKPQYDLVFLDIKMPYMNGMDAAERLRELDPEVMLIFVTSMKQYAIAGYTVNAFDFIVKPIEYSDFEFKMTRAYRRLSARIDGSEPDILLTTDKGIIKVKPSDIRYVETADGHNIVYRMGGSGADITRYSSLKAAESELIPFGFARCNSCYLVNLKHVRSIKGYTVDVDGVELQISQPRRKAFIDELMKFVDKK